MSNLAAIPVGSRGRVLEISGGDSASVRLLEMGLTPGSQFEVVGVAPLGDPIELQLRGYRLSLRKNEASKVLVAVDGSESGK